jgi:hypothetical protein
VQRSSFVVVCVENFLNLGHLLKELIPVFWLALLVKNKIHENLKKIKFFSNFRFHLAKKQDCKNKAFSFKILFFTSLCDKN